MRHRRWTFLVPAGLLGLAACGDPGPADAVRKTIGPEGGLIASHDEVLSIVILPGALTRDVEIEVFPSDEPPPIFGPAYRVRPHVELLVDAEITYRRVLPSNPNAATVAAIRIDDYTAEMGHWVPLPRLALRPEQQAVIAIDDELSLYYGLLEDASAPPLPGDDGDDVPQPTDDGPEPTTTTTTSGPDTTTGEPGETTMGVDLTTGDDGPAATTDDGGPASTTEPGGSTSGGMGDEMGNDDGMMGVIMCGDGMPQAGELCLAPGGDAPAGLGPVDVGTGDLDGDGNVDVVTLDATALDVGVLFGNGDGTVGAPGAGTALTGVPTRLEVGDFTGDGELDVAVLDTEAGAVQLLAGNGVGALANPMATPVGIGVVDMVADAFDPGAALDLAVLNAGADTVQMLLGGAGGLAAGPTAAVGAAIDDAIGSGSLNPGGDAFADVMALGAPGFHAWATNGLGTDYIGELTGVFGAGGTWAGLAAGDVDEDGDDDVVAIDTAGDALVLGLSTGGPANFVFAAPVAVGADPSDVALADLDGDGDLDVVVSNATSGDVMVFAWNGGAFALAFTLDAGTNPSAVAVGQLDADGVPDVVVANAGSDSVTILLSDP